MIRAILLLIILNLSAMPVYAKKNVTIRVSCTIPQIVRINRSSAKVKKDTIVQYKNTIRNNRKVLIKTVLSK